MFKLSSCIKLLTLTINSSALRRQSKILFLALSFLFMLPISDLKAQEPSIADQYNMSVIPPLPNAAAFSKYVDVPVGHYTGIPNISIPLVSLQSKVLSTNVGLSYHASGLRVDEISSNVGLGWSLQAGGMISRTVKGLPDDSNHGYLNLDPNIALNPPNNDVIVAYEDKYDLMAGGQLDSEPDVFSFSVDGYSGKFVLDRMGVPVLIPYSDVKIVPTFTNCSDGTTICAIDSWKLTTPQGTVYTINVREGSQSISEIINGEGLGYNVGSIYTSTWYLSKVEDANKIDVLEYIYEDTPNTYEYEVAATQYREFNIPLTIQCQNCNNETLPVTTIQTIKTFQGRTLKQINSLYGKIVFETANRTDLPGGDKITAVSHFGPSDELLKRFDFEQSSFQINNSTTLSHLQDQSIYSRLRLDKVIESCSGNTHQLTYNEGSLPPRLSPSQDHWGLYNGANNTMLLPAIYECGAEPTYEGADRRANASFSKIGMLQSIVNPLGGKTTFEFEGNLIENELAYPLIRDELLPSIAHELNDYISLTADAFVSNSSSGTDTDIFTIEEEQCVLVSISLFSDNGQDLDGDVVLERIGGSGYAIPDNGTINITLVPGEYKITATASQYTTAAISVLYATIEPKVNLEVGGLRIKRILIEDGLPNGTQQIRKFKYAEFENDLISSGKLISPVRYDYPIDKLTSTCDATTSGGVGYCFIKCKYTAQVSNSKYPLATSQGSHIVYPKVTELKGEIGEFGKTEYTFSIFKDVISHNLYTPANTSREWQRGLLLDKIDYKNEGGNFAPIASLENNYILNESTHFKKVFGLVLRWRYNDVCPNLNVYSLAAGDEIQFQSYDWESRWLKLDHSIQTKDGVSVRTDYEYNADGEHTNVTATSMENSDGKVHVSNLSYAHEVGNSAMIEKNMIGMQLKSEHEVDGSSIGGQEVIFENIASLIVPVQQIELLSDGSSRIRKKSGVLYFGWDASRIDKKCT